MVRLKELIECPHKRQGKRVRLRVKVLGRKKCDDRRTFMKTRSDVFVYDEICVYSDPLPYHLRGKEIEAERTVEVLEGRIHLSRPRIISYE